MLIRCSACNSKYLVNSADLKPDGRMVECASCSHQWYQEKSTEEEILFSLAPSSKNDLKQTQDIANTKIELNKFSEIVEKITRKNSFKPYPDINNTPN